MPEFDWRAPESYKSVQDAEITDIAWEYLRRNPDYRRDYEEMVKAGRVHNVTPNSGGDGASAFAHDPQGSFHEQTIFWAPEALPTVVPISRRFIG